MKKRTAMTRIICDSQDLASHTVMSDGVATVRQTLGWGRINGAHLRYRLISPVIVLPSLEFGGNGATIGTSGKMAAQDEIDERGICDS